MRMDSNFCKEIKKNDVIFLRAQTYSPVGEAEDMVPAEEAIQCQHALGAEGEEREGLIRLFHLHIRAILGAANRILQDRGLAEDVLQETFLRVWEIRKQIDERRSLKGLVLKIATNLSLDILRKRGRELTLDAPEEDEASAPRQIADPRSSVSPENQILIRRALERIPPALRLPLELRYGEGLSYGEIALMLDLTSDAVAQRIRRGKEKLRIELGATRKGE